MTSVCPICSSVIIDKGSIGINIDGEYNHSAHLAWCSNCKQNLIDHSCNCDQTCKENKLHCTTDHHCKDCKAEITCDEAHGKRIKLHTCRKPT